jgi:hypothetical protein
MMYEDGAVPPPDYLSDEDDTVFVEVKVIDRREVISEPPPKRFKYGDADDRVFDSDSPDDYGDKDYVFRNSDLRDIAEYDDDEDVTPTRRRQRRQQQLRKLNGNIKTDKTVNGTKNTSRVWNTKSDEDITPTRTRSSGPVPVIPKPKKDTKERDRKRVSGYQIFYSEHCRMMKERGLSVNKSPARTVAEAWGKLSESEKEAYQRKARQAMGLPEDEEEEITTPKVRAKPGRKPKVQYAESSSSEEEEEAETEYGTLINKALQNELLSTRQHASVKKLITSRAHEPEIIILMNLLKECVDDSKIWTQNDGSEYVDNMIKIL